MSVVGVDTGGRGALAHIDGDYLDVEDMPHFEMHVGKTMRRRVDGVGLMEYFEVKKMMGVKLVVIEAVGGRPKQSSGFIMGWNAGLVYQSCIAVKLTIDTVPPQVWKKVMAVPGKMKGAGKLEKKDASLKMKANATEIIHRADEVFPNYRNVWRGPQGGFRLDRAEAALLAKYGQDYALRSEIHAVSW